VQRIGKDIGKELVELFGRAEPDLPYGLGPHPQREVGDVPAAASARAAPHGGHGQRGAAGGLLDEQAKPDRHRTDRGEGCGPRVSGLVECVADPGGEAV
jgi:hypothetical protein